MDVDRLVGAVARRQHGQVTIAQLDEMGISRSARRHRVDRGLWEVVQPGVLRVAGVPPTWHGRACAASLTAPGSVVSHLAAAHLWGFEGFGPVGVIDVTVPRHQRPRCRPGVRYHESLAFELRGETTRAGIPVTGVARTVLDVCASVHDDYRALAALDDARRRALVTWEELLECLILHARRGRSGITRFRRVLDRRLGRSVPHGRFARLVERLFEDAGLPAPVHELWVSVGGNRYRIDMAYPDLLIAIELDGRGHETQFEDDRIRRNRLETAGWLVLHFTWRRLLEDPGAIVAEVLAAIRLRSGGRGGPLAAVSHAISEVS